MALLPPEFQQYWRVSCSINIVVFYPNVSSLRTLQVALLDNYLADLPTAQCSPENTSNMLITDIKCRKKRSCKIVSSAHIRYKYYT